MAVFADFEEYVDMLMPAHRKYEVIKLALLRFGWAIVTRDQGYPFHITINPQKVTQALQKAVVLDIPIQE